MAAPPVITGRQSSIVKTFSIIRSAIFPKARINELSMLKILIPIPPMSPSAGNLFPPAPLDSSLTNPFILIFSYNLHFFTIYISS